MKKKLPIRVISMLLCAAMLWGIPAYAAETPETRASERIALSMCTIGKTNDGRLSAYFMVRANDIMDVIGATSVEIQRQTLFGWVREFTFTSDDYPALLAANNSRHGEWVHYTPLFPGSTYRAVANIYVRNSTGTSTQSLPSDPV